MVKCTLKTQRGRTTYMTLEEARKSLKDLELREFAYNLSLIHI
mgnify:CR=1 FL=1